jgi:uncharacterized integral membrane protein
MKRINFVFTLVLVVLMLAPVFALFAQDDYTNYQVEMADAFRKDGKIYVVVAILGTVLVGLLAYAFTIDRKLSRLEKQIEK